MGLNLETLIGILVILILLIGADGLRRVWRERQGRLRMNIRPRPVGDDDDEAWEEDNPEVLGSARVVRRNESVEEPPLVMEAEDESPAVEPEPGHQPRLFPDESSVAEVADPASPPIGPRREEQQPEPPPVAPEERKYAEEKESPEESEHESRSPEPAMDRSANAVEDRPAPGESAGDARRDEPMEVLVVHLLARQGERFPGARLLQLLLERGLRFGEMNIFHCHHQEEEGQVLQFSMANAVEPGTFDIDEMEEQEFAGVTFFLKMPGPSNPLQALDRMLEVARELGELLNGELRDHQRSVLTRQTEEHMRERVQEFQRRRRLAHGR